MLRYKRHKAKRLTISSRVPVHTKQQVGYLRANLSLTNIILLFNRTATHARSTKQLHLRHFTIEQPSNHTETYLTTEQIHTTGCCYFASFAFLRVRAQGDQHRGNRFHQRYDCNSGACITRILIRGRFLVLRIARPINGLLRQTKAIAKHNKCPSH